MQVIIPPTPHTGFQGDRWAGIQTHRDRHTHHRSSEVPHIQSLRWYLPLALIILPWSIACSHSNTVCGWQVCQEVPAQAENENTNKLHHLQDMQCSPSHYLVIQTFAFMFYLDSTAVRWRRMQRHHCFYLKVQNKCKHGPTLFYLGYLRLET